MSIEQHIPVRVKPERIWISPNYPNLRWVNYQFDGGAEYVLASRLAALEEENERLKQHCKDLDADLQGTLDDCNKLHGEGGL